MITINFSDDPNAHLSAKAIKQGSTIYKIIWKIGDLEIILNEAQAEIVTTETSKILYEQ